MTQTVAITGASVGIGRAAAGMFAGRGDRVALIARGPAGLDGAARDVERAGRTALAISADRADFAQVKAAAQQIEDTFGPVDVWVNVAFAPVFAPFAEVTPALLDRYLAKTGYDSQHTAGRERPGQPDNLWEPVDSPPGDDHGAHGKFDDKSHPRSVQLLMSQHRLAVTAAGAATAAAGAALAARLLRR